MNSNAFASSNISYDAKCVIHPRFRADAPCKSPARDGISGVVVVVDSTLLLDRSEGRSTDSVVIVAS